MTVKDFSALLRSAASKWSFYNAPRLGASLAYYTLLSMAPMLILIVGICGLVFSKASAQQQLLSQVEALAGTAGAKTVQLLVANAHQAGNGVFAASIALITLLFGASGVFLELRSSLNLIWDAPQPVSSTWRDFVRQRLISFVMVIALGALLLGSLLLSAAIGVSEKFFASYVPTRFALFGEAGNFVLSFIALSVLFALLFKFVPNVPICWREVAIGAMTTTLLFIAGKNLLALYFTTAGVGSTYGAAGSLVATVIWVYYSAQIFFFGALLTKSFADHLGTPEARQQRSTARKAAKQVSGAQKTGASA